MNTKGKVEVYQLIAAIFLAAFLFGGVCVLGDHPATTIKGLEAAVAERLPEMNKIPVHPPITIPASNSKYLIPPDIYVRYNDLLEELPASDKDFQNYVSHEGVKPFARLCIAFLSKIKEQNDEILINQEKLITLVRRPIQ